MGLTACPKHSSPSTRLLSAISKSMAVPSSRQRLRHNELPLSSCKLLCCTLRGLMDMFRTKTIMHLALFSQLHRHTASCKLLHSKRHRFVWVDDSVRFLSVEKPLNHILRTRTSDETSSVTDIMNIARVGAAVAMPLNHAKSSTP